MWEQLKKFVKDCLTGIDGESYDPARIAVIATMTVYHFNSVYNLVHGHVPFDPQAYGIGAAAIMAAGAWGIHAKKDCEPGEKHG
jgi:hypothetical protein